MIDTVHCYFEDIGSYLENEKMLPLWERTWKKHGWKTAILRKAHAMRHPLHDQLIAHVNTLPTVNAHDYENACYRRHLAMALVGDSLLTDYDVINNGFTPEMMPPLSDTIDTLDAGAIPCAAFGTQKAWNEWIDVLMNHQATNGETHVSDMTIFQIHHPVRNYFCNHLLSHGWDKLPLIHFNANGCGSMKPGVLRHLVIEEFLSK